MNVAVFFIVLFIVSIVAFNVSVYMRTKQKYPLYWAVGLSVFFAYQLSVIAAR